MAEKKQNQSSNPNQKPRKKPKYWTGQRVVFALLALVMAILMLLPMFSMITGTAQAASESDIRGQLDGLKDEAADAKTKKQELQQELAAVQGQKDKALQEKQLRDQELAYIDQEISNTEQQIAYYDTLIAAEQESLNAAKAREEAQYQLFCKRVRAMEEAGTTSYWSILFSASDFSDLLSRAVDIQDLMDYDNAVIDQLQADRQAVADSLSALEAVQADQQTQKALLDQQRQEQSDKVKAAAQALTAAQNDVEEAQKLLDKQAAEEKAVNDALAAKEAELEKKIRENQIKFAVSGDWMWPLPAQYVTLTSAFGYRIHPITHRPNSHTGIDVPAPKNTPIYAAKSGVVTISERGSSYGNYVVISHGDGTSTLYAHMNSRAASEGDVVKQGQVIGYVGTTGNSTGNHLHLEVRVNGERQNPESYYPNIAFIRNY